MAIITDIASLVELTPQQTAAVSLWEQDIEADIEARARLYGLTLASLDPAQVERFKREAILWRLNHPDDAVQVTTSVDDTSMSRRYASSTGQLEYLPLWWSWLGLDGPLPGSMSSFTIAPSWEM